MYNVLGIKFCEGIIMANTDNEHLANLMKLEGNYKGDIKQEIKVEKAVKKSYDKCIIFFKKRSASDDIPRKKR